MKRILHLFVFLSSLTGIGQTDTSFICSPPVMAEFPGGYEAYAKYLRDSAHYPAEEKAKGIQGTAYVQFAVSITGEIEDVKLVKGVQHGPGLNAEAVRLIAAMPDWKPMMNRGKPERVLMTQPIRFTLDTSASTARTVSPPPAKLPPYAFVEPAVEDEVLNPPLCNADTLTNDTIPAEFPGGSTEQWKFIGANTKYPATAKEKGHQGQVLVVYDVEADGSVTNVRVLKGVEGAPELDAEAVRVVKLFPKHTPAMVNGKPVKSEMYAGVKFSLAR